jgi:hypothetical protein
MHGSAIALLEEPKTSRRRDHANQLSQEMYDLRDSIARRTFEIFASRGSTPATSWPIGFRPRWSFFILPILRFRNLPSR